MGTDFPFDIIGYEGGAFQPLRVTAVRETPLRISVNGREVVTLLCTGTHPRYLAAGYLLACGLIQDAKDIIDLAVKEDEAGIEARALVRDDPAVFSGLSVTSGLGRMVGTDRQPASVLPFQPSWVRPDALIGLAGELHARSDLYRLTRGCHNSSLCTAEEMLLFRSDIGRHNAIDTLVGQCLLEGLPTGDTMIVTTGRVASEIALKAVRAGVPVLASTAVATDRAVESAREHGLTLIGNVTDKGFWVYNDPGRLAGR